MKEYSAHLRSEFAKLLSQRRAMYGGSDMFAYNKLPLPANFPVYNRDSRNNSLGRVRGVKMPYFSSLNGETVQILDRSTTVYRRKLGLDRDFMRTADGKYVYDKVPVKQNCVAILSDCSIRRPNYIEKDGRRIPVPSDNMFEYVDYVQKNDGSRGYIYIIPKRNVFHLNLCALIMTPSNLRSHYGGIKLVTQNGGNLTLCVVPYKKRQGEYPYRILSVDNTYRFTDRIKALVDYWVQVGVIFNIYMEDEASVGLMYKNLDETLDSSLFEPESNVSLEEEGKSVLLSE